MEYYNGNKDIVFTPTSHTLSLISSGEMSSVKTGDCTVYRYYGRKDWSMFFVKKGCLYVEGQKLRNGDVFIYPPNVSQKYTMYSKDDTVYHYIHFTGEDVDKLFAQLKISPRQVYNVDPSLTSPFLEKIDVCAFSKDPVNTLKAEYNLIGLVIILAEKCRNKGDVTMGAVTHEMRRDIKRPFNVDFYASIVNLSVSRFNHVFKKETGVSPLNYYIIIRMETAKSLLIYTDMKVGKIAENVGYDDLLYFSKAFKKYTGVSPSEYRLKSGNISNKI
jgi:AraC-like DNA-binding protein